ncbi:SH3 and multiple ankyrin repeat domains protein 1-like [Silurus asotus]|uniref:SH3 and multiple ankyrin repeat domains protein 1-like n=1 Tax=Silurus asotus TaxID=30991 RepID=A0AAD5APY6_SILAS|nr:SH3 and multiple ankyrin repeat domains protein 1-like [Silurus asotus]
MLSTTSSNILMKKCLRFDPDATVWSVKQQVVCSLSESLWDVYNYGLFQPASEGHHARFLEEEQSLRQIPQSLEKGVPYLEFRYKSRVYKQTNLDEKQLAKLHTKANLKKFLDYVQSGAVEKIHKALDKGLDPNYHDPESGETPLTLAVISGLSVDGIRVLLLNGAHHDFRSRDGLTPLHKAVRAHSQATLLACQHGFAQHLEHLLFYGADTTSQNASGNTALHISALYNKESCVRVLLYRGANKEMKNKHGQTPFQESCVRVLLYRGANKEMKNKHGQTPFQVAVMSGHFELGEIIKNHNNADVVIREKERRKTSTETAGKGEVEESEGEVEESGGSGWYFECWYYDWRPSGKGVRAGTLEVFKLFYHGVDGKRNGVGGILKEEYSKSVVEVKRVSDRVMIVKLEVEGMMINVISV